uniref:RNA polymerase-associated protein RTF1 homolog (Trinotate prediction) n=1 Tax=Myxobolus squamalis TaxID=59785 RepID=A0A6B2FXP0_MYXSQ
MSEREREEEIFRKMEEEESKKMRMEITRSLKRKRVEEGSLSEGDSMSGLSMTASPKRLKVSDVFGDSDEEASSPTHNELSDPEIEKIGELESVRLSRYRLEKWMYMPFFNDRIPGFFVRVNIGTKNNEPLYRVYSVS